MSDLRVVITGASGFIGAQLVVRLSRLKCEVLVMCRTKPNYKSTSPVSWLQADLSLPSTYEDRVRSFCPEVIIHLAWQDIPDYSFEKSVANHDQSLKFLSFITGLASMKYFFPMLKTVELVCGVLLLSGKKVLLAIVMLAPIVINIFLFHYSLDPSTSVLPGCILIAYLIF